MRKRILSLLLAIIMTISLGVVAFADEAIVASGNCGANDDKLTWTLTSNGTLTISGEGEMKECEPYSYPWCVYMESVQTICIKNGVESIGSSAFADFNGLKSVTIPESVSDIGLAAFCMCKNMLGISVASNNQKYMSRDGVLFDKSGKTLITCPGQKKGNYQIPDGVTVIEANAFYSCGLLTSVTIPDSVTDINGCAFADCDGLTSIVIPNGVTRIDTQAFAYCSKLASVGIPDSVTEIGDGSFCDCESLTDVYYGGTAVDWAKITVGVFNDPLQNAEIHYQLAAPTVKPSYVGASGKPYIYWGAVDGANRYYVYRSTTKDGTYSFLGSTANLNYTDSKADAGTTYYYKVKAGIVNGVKSNSSAAVTITCRCARPVVKPSYVGASGKPYIYWGAVDGANRYYVYRSTTKDGTYSFLGSTANLNYTDSKADAGTTYYYKVKAGIVNGAKSASSAAVAVTCRCARPVVKPSYVGASGKPYIYWSAVDGAGKYYVYRSTSKNGTYEYIGYTTKNNYTDNKAVAGTTYYYKVKGISSVKSTANSALSTPVTITCRCARPVVKVTTTSAGKPKLTWSAVTGASKYEIYRATSKNGTYAKIYTTTGLSLTNTSAKAGTTYYYKVKAISKVKSTANSAFSTVVSIRAR